MSRRVTIVCGGRYFSDDSLMYPFLLNQHVLRPFTKIVTGGAPGADSLANAWATDLGIDRKIYRADWYTYGKYAGPHRNREMLRCEQPDDVIAFPGGRGTADMIRAAKEAGVPVIEVETP